MKKSAIVLAMILTTLMLFSCQSEKISLAVFLDSSFTSAENDFYCDGENMYCVSGSYQTSYSIDSITNKNSDIKITDDDCPDDFRLHSVRGAQEDLFVSAVDSYNETAFFAVSCGDGIELDEICRIDFVVSEWTISENKLVIVGSSGSSIEPINRIFVCDIEAKELSCITSSAAVYAVEDGKIIYAEYNNDSFDVIEYEIKTGYKLNRVKTDKTAGLVGISSDYFVISEAGANNTTDVYMYSFESGEKSLISTEENAIISFRSNDEAVCYLTEKDNEYVIHMYLCNEDEIKTVSFDKCEVASFVITKGNSMIVKVLRDVLSFYTVTDYYFVDPAGNISLIGTSK